jgi:hypothetical protein
LPGTALRATAGEDGVAFDPAPPYRVQRTATFSEEALRETLFEAEEVLGRRLDEWPRPHLSEGGLDGFAPAQLPGPQHAALWFRGGALFERRGEILRAIDGRLGLDPYATLDVVLQPRGTFPLDLLDAVRARLQEGPQSYLSRSLAHRGEDAQRRIAVVLDGEHPADFAEALDGQAQVFREQSAVQALRDAERLGIGLPAARITGAVTPAQFEELSRRAGADFVAFADPALERSWQERVLGFGDAR